MTLLSIYAITLNAHIEVLKNFHGRKMNHCEKEFNIKRKMTILNFFQKKLFNRFIFDEGIIQMSKTLDLDPTEQYLILSTLIFEL
ncbi:hypothetical protein BpHYR1_019130 [Brachionus plicatilis]|uniref:Uncharacterized protein n=1 Tax=Brachionus plicatilis TaxID=10195 RepID=A0A3M7RHE5_BRAPC|nr:hypothetical protein BpHYR1_019130 [Brachionus plicatilis]